MRDDLSEIVEIFRFDQNDLIKQDLNDGYKFAYYTTADIAKKILEKKEVWLRNAHVMSDYSELAYGLGLFENAVSSSSGKDFFKALNSCCTNVENKILGWYQEWKTSLLMDTFITCLSLHHPSEDDNGRLSMWRAYGNVAIVLNNSKLVNESSALGVWSLRVNYLSQVEYEEHLSSMAESILQHSKIIAREGESFIRSGVYNLFLGTAIGTKHPGFAEEKEYRAYANPSHHTISKKIVKKIVDINGVPQEILILPLEHDPEHELFRLDIPSILDSIIVGPTQYPFPVAKAFATLLNEAGIDNAHEKVTVSGIPLRTIP